MVQIHLSASTYKHGGYSAAQVYELSSMHFLPKEWIMERWEDGFYITAMAGSAGGSSLVVMSKGTPYTQQSYKVREQPSVAAVRDWACSPPTMACLTRPPPAGLSVGASTRF